MASSIMNNVARMPATMARSSAKAPAAKAVAAPRLSARSFLGNRATFSTKSISAKKATRFICKAVGDDAEKISDSYAIALAEVANANNALESVQKDFETLAQIITPETQTFLSNPLMADDKKKNVLVKICDDASFTPYTVNFLKLLVDKKRIGIINDMIQAFEDVYCELTDTEVCSVTSASKLSKEDQFQIAKKLQELTGAKNIKLKPNIDPEILGGFVVRYGQDGSSAADYSVAAELEGMLEGASV